MVRNNYLSIRMAFELVIVVAMVLSVRSGLSALIGEKCENDRNCAFGTSECIFRFNECTEKACWCKPDYGGRFADSCHKKLDLADRCNGRGGAPLCPEHTYCDYERDECIHSITAGSSCTSGSGSTSCTADASCSNNICTCSTGYKKVDGRCVLPDLGDACTYNCRSNYFCQSSPSTCQCMNSNYTRLTYSQEGEDVTRCVHAQATKGVEVGGACLLGVTSNFGKICGSGLTCSKCLDEDAPTCITPQGGADGVKAGFFILTASLLLTQLM